MDGFWLEPEETSAQDADMSLYPILSLLCFILWIVALIDCLKNDTPNKLVWVIVIILLPFLGSILYFLIGRGGRKA